mmetsp:Transcript_56697/g.132507  ORF Transcript_56697/g.132507 Transcript_56697/m.132507 type:complete len:108 (+) Transcript_56697:237-560(+)
MSGDMLEDMPQDTLADMPEDTLADTWVDMAADSSKDMSAHVVTRLLALLEASIQWVPAAVAPRGFPGAPRRRLATADEGLHAPHVLRGEDLGQTTKALRAQAEAMGP